MSTFWGEVKTSVNTIISDDVKYDKDTVQQWFIDYKCNDDLQARENIILACSRLVVQIAKKYYNPNVKSNRDMEDIVSIGMVGLIKGVNAYNPEKGAYHSSYLGMCIENSMRIHFRDNNKYNSEMQLDTPIDSTSEGDEITLMDRLQDMNADTEHNFEVKETARELIDFINSWENERYKQIVLLYYGINKQGKCFTPKEIIKMLNVSQAQVSRVLSMCEVNCREYLEQGKDYKPTFTKETMKKSTKKRLRTQEIAPRVVDMYNQGASITQLKNLFGICEATVNKILRTYGGGK